MHKVVARHLAAINSGYIDRGTVIGIRKLVSASTRKYNGWSVGGGQAIAPMEEIDALLTRLLDVRPRTTGELTEGGLKLLRSKRNAKLLQSQGVTAEIVERIDGFRLVDWDLLGRWQEYFVPHYVATAGEEELFAFYNIPWQSGGNGPVIL